MSSTQKGYREKSLKKKNFLTKKELFSYISDLEKRNNLLEASLIEDKNAKHEILERVKELSCMYEIAKILTIEDNIEDVFLKIVQCLPHGWQYPQFTAARIIVDNKTIQLEDFCESEYCQKEDIVIDNTKHGSIEVFLAQGNPEQKNCVFLKEEQDLIKGVANLIALKIKQHKIKETKSIIRQQLLHADRLATIGQLAAGVAHELNEPLANILGFAQLSLKAYKGADQIAADLKKIEDSAFHAREIIKKLMEFSRQSPPSSKEIDFSKTIDESIYFLESRCCKEGISLNKKYTDELVVNADSNQLKQVVTNLVINAIQAIENEGEILLETTSDSTHATLFVKDNGKGISTKDIDKIFMPFFTTKDIGEGTGLGLSVVYGIIKNHSGDIKVSSKEGRGTIFQVSFPLKKDQVLYERKN